MHADNGEGREFCQRRNMEYNRRSSQQGEPHQLDSIWQILINIKAKTTSSKTMKDQQSRVKQETGTGRVLHTAQLCFPSDEPDCWNPLQCSRQFLVLGKATQLDHLQSCGFEHFPG